jgi:hypothetical protein
LLKLNENGAIGILYGVEL